MYVPHNSVITIYLSSSIVTGNTTIFDVANGHNVRDRMLEIEREE